MHEFLLSTADGVGKRHGGLLDREVLRETVAATLVRDLEVIFHVKIAEVADAFQG
jgi:hypothetical protein